MTDSPYSRYRRLVKNCEINEDPAQAALVERLEALHKTILEPGFFNRKPGLLRHVMGKRLHENRPYGMYIWGEVGRGKSLLMDIFFESLPFPEKKRVHFHAFMLSVHARMHELRKEEQTFDPLLIVANEIAKKYNVLCFDEMQVNDIADAMILSRLFTEIFEKGSIVLFTSNRPPEDLYKHGLQRERFLPFIHLLRERIEVEELTSREDYRLRNMAAMEKTYLTPINWKTEGELKEIFERMSHHAIAAPEEIIVKKRVIHIPKVCRDMAWFHFDDLCAQPHGAEDYLELARLFRNIFIVGIPKMGKEMRNEAKRFVTLIDILYEQGVKLFCTAEAEPNKLYEEGDGSFEFARTASRLTEMRTKEYLKLKAKRLA